MNKLKIHCQSEREIWNTVPHFSDNTHDSLQCLSSVSSTPVYYNTLIALALFQPHYSDTCLVCPFFICWQATGSVSNALCYTRDAIRLLIQYCILQLVGSTGQSFFRGCDPFFEGARESCSPNPTLLIQYHHNSSSCFGFEQPLGIEHFRSSL